MMAELARTDTSATIERALIGGDLSKLSPDQRVSYYQAVCASLGLNPLTKPFDYITLNGKLTLYARKDAADQLRKINNISIAKPDVSYQDDWIIVTVAAHDGNGRTDSDVGAVSRKDMRGDFGNALMKAVTKAKRRVTLSICGLGMLDETEVETIPDAHPALEAPVVREIRESEPTAPTPDPEPAAESPSPDYPTERWHAFRDYVVATLDHYAAGKHVLFALRLCYGEDYQPWTQWSADEAARCWDCLTQRIPKDEDEAQVEYAADDPKRPFTE